MNNDIRSADYYARANRIFLGLLWLHLPIAVFTAWATSHSLGFAATASLAILSLPTLLVLRNSGSLESSITLGMAIVSFSALLIHSSGGMTEMHFHIFSALGLLITLAQPLAVIAALGVVVVHHLGFYFFLPSSLINYAAGLDILVVHALFALATGVPSAFIAKKFKLYIVGVKSIIEEVRQISENMKGASDSMLENATLLSASTTEEASAIQETAASLEELQAMITKNSENAASTEARSKASREKSRHGESVVAELMGSLGEIRKNSEDVVGAVNHSNSRINEILDMIQEISVKTSVINDIVFQTKLLSFNASIEAARAGEHGKGFAVVAEEVGKLAVASGVSAKEIGTLLEKSLRNVRVIIEETKAQVGGIVDQGKTRIERGLVVATECHQVLAEISREVETMTIVSEEISAASREQQTGVTEITRAMTEVERATSRNTEVAQAATGTAQNLNEGADHLQRSVIRLVNVLESGRAA